ncbi:hypothetical protein [Mycoplasmopsis cynos]|uniref:hypothetical protein n=1 Tax=Mycoplasmopsis cynos TaxID=171284 RepID=UPI0024C79F3C|nr:hypothetical protein [Mycoplasmopsis cynos]WAM09084.1 hypothetical protein ONA03_01825 [Mycoplasmopsis cynos]
MPDNLEIIMNEFENLISNYKEISYDLIENVVAKYSKNQAFSFLNSIETYDLKKYMINILKELQKVMKYIYC